MIEDDNELHFFYDVQNKSAIVVFNGTPYSSVKNLQGDIVAVLNSAGAAVVNYVYDARGRPISKTGSMASTLGTVQPFRYRGYVYDEETKLYYLCSRYFNIHWQRFMNADSVLLMSLLAANQQTYCRNNPIMHTDHSGRNFFEDSWNWLCEAANDISALCKESYEDFMEWRGVSFEQDSDGTGGKIVNSYRLFPGEMLLYACYLKSENTSVYRGTTTGFLFEWEVHNLAYYVLAGIDAPLSIVEDIGMVDEPLISEDFIGRFADVDFEATIFDDNHEVLTDLMCGVYGVIFPWAYVVDLYIDLFSGDEGG